MLGSKLVYGSDKTGCKRKGMRKTRKGKTTMEKEKCK